MHAGPVHCGVWTESASSVAASATEQTECYGEHTGNAGGNDQIETEAKLHTEISDVDRLLSLVELRQLLRHQVTEAVDGHTRAN